MLCLHYAPDNASLIIRIALEELGLPYETRLVDRQAEAQKSPAYLALNPQGLIPVLETPEGPIFETAAILLWLGET
ncbi:MAG: glutathione S-transferase N-terminal domain-containing protein, partial [Maritimibacter sp.]|nr:glutathione S-transferase N-terminal domain-containing protein [Maritimibacter sp.]